MDGKKHTHLKKLLERRRCGVINTRYPRGEFTGLGIKDTFCQERGKGIDRHQRKRGGSTPCASGARPRKTKKNFASKGKKKILSTEKNEKGHQGVE